MVVPVKRPPLAVIALLALALLGSMEWPWASGFSIDGAVCNVTDQCSSPEARHWLLATRLLALAVVVLWVGSALTRTWTRGAGTGPIRSDVSLRVAAPLAAAGLVAAAGWCGTVAAFMSVLLGSVIGGVTILGATTLGLVRGLEGLVDATWGRTRPALAAQLAWLAALTGALSALVAAGIGGGWAATVSAAVTVALVIVTCDALARRGLRTLAVPLAVVACTLVAVLAAAGYLTLLMRAFVDEASKPGARPSAAGIPDSPTRPLPDAPPAAPRPKIGRAHV